ncbi:MAG: hypothetical protein PHU49_00385 [Syntrophorhabdaceae bacterium]|nr:hypothetical protein [Syntrophorhabdaceae bacterium]
MEKEVWNLSATIAGNFFLVKNEDLFPKSPPHSSLKNLKLIPQFDKQGKQNGIFELEMQFEVNSVENHVDSKLPADLGRKLFYHFIDILTFLSGYPITILKGPSLVFHFSDVKKHRTIAFSDEYRSFGPMVPIINTSLLSSLEIDSVQKRIMSWFRKGLQEPDIVNAVISFCVSLEIMADQFPCNEGVNRKCQHCGYVSIIDPGMRQKIETFMVNQIGFTKADFRKVWEVRNSLFHGGYDSYVPNATELHSTRRILTVSIVKGLKKLLKLMPDEPPSEDPAMFPFYDPFLDVVYRDP